MDDVLIIGGGVIGLSLAYELARNDQRVRVIDRGSPGQESSWAGAGILPPAVFQSRDPAYEQLTSLSHALHAQWSQRLREETLVDTGYCRSGGIYLARGESEIAQLHQFADTLKQRGIEAIGLSREELSRCEPALNGRGLAEACLLPDECQLRNPRHVKALLAACALHGVQIQAGTQIDDFVVRNGRIEAALAGAQSLRASQYCIAGGAWSRTILARLGQTVSIKPIRGQIVLLAGRPIVKRIINDGHRYLVPRSDGRLLVGSTEEDVGYDKRNTAEAIGDLLRFALDLVPGLHDHTIERTWAGLRPGNADGFPYLGRIPAVENGFIAAGHYRHGLHLSPATAVVMSQLLRGEPTQVDLAPFRIDRG
jgi:glycine oxidase